ncbi:hypothetical protein AnigIFM59636_009432 [Aspergillus niger]|nr:hypothetical protein AnigIFM59636_009432 [Aspergillus niger]
MKRSSTSSVISSYWELQKAMANLSGMVAYCALEHACVRELIPVMQDPAYDQQAYYSEQWMHRTPPKATEDDLYDQGNPGLLGSARPFQCQRRNNGRMRRKSPSVSEGDIAHER